MAVMTAIAVGSALVSAYGQYKSSKAQAAASEQQAQLNFFKAEEILSRNNMNNELLRESALVKQGEQTVQTFGSGRTLASTSRLVRDTMTRAANQIELNNRAAEWEASMVRLGAESQISSSVEIEQAGRLQAAGTAGFGTAQAFASSPGGKKTT